MHEKIFTAEVKKQADEIVGRYENKRAGILPVLKLIQDRYGHLGPEACEAVSGYFGIPPVDVEEIVTFYTLFWQKPGAWTRLHICRTLTCSLAGSEAMAAYLSEKLGVKEGEMTPDGMLSFHEVECLGACDKAPAMQINDREVLGPLTREKIDEIIKAYRAGSASPEAGR